ncbi:MAG: RnfABCDGE type electron transport complex subunit B [bacterium]
MSGIVIYSVVSLTAMGAVFGLVLAIAAKRFAVARDHRIEEIESMLAGANCGACGYGGCGGFAKALVAGKASPYDCSPSGVEVADRIAELLGAEKVEKKAMVAMVGCRGGDRVAIKMDYSGITSCKALALLADNLRLCSYGCIGLGTCVEVCPFNAIRMVDGFAEVDDSKCTGCGKCVDACPKGIIYLVPKTNKVRIACSSHGRGKEVKAICEVGCIGCGICVKSCPVKCIELVDNLPVIDHSRCINCGICAAKCPTKSIVDRVKARPKAFIGTDCTGCGECIRVCQFKAIEGEEGKRHRILLEKCIGCGLCMDVCKEKAISIAGALGHHTRES